MTTSTHELWSFLLVFARVAAMFMTAPLFGDRGAPRTTKAGFAAICTLALLPLLAGRIPAAPSDSVALTGAIAAETAVGLAIGFLVQLVMSAFQIAGYYIDTQMGLGIINILNPFTQQQTSAVGQFMYQLGLTLFFVAGGHLLLIGALAGSYMTIAPGAAHFSGDIGGATSSIVGQLFVIAFKIAAPAAAVLMVVEVAFGIIARTVPQMNVFIVGIPLKILVGLATLALALPVFALVVQQLPGEIGTALHAFLSAAR